MHLFKRGDLIIPLKQCGGWTATLNGALVELPDGIEDRVIVRIEDVLLEPRVACDMDLCNTFRRDAVNVNQWVEIVILRRDIDIVDVEKNPAIGCVNAFTQE